MKLDHDELRLYNAFAQIQTNTESLERKVRANMNIRKVIKPTPRKRVGLLAVALIAVMMLAGTVYAAVNMGVFERFMAEHNPDFGQVVSPVEMYTIDQGIRVDIIAAQQFGNNAIMYVSVRDISGQNRVTPYASITPVLRTTFSEDRLGFGSINGSMEALYFNQETNTAYFQIEFHQDTPFTDVMELIIHNIELESRRTEAPFPVALSDMTAAPTMPNPDLLPAEFVTWCAEYILVPTRGGNFPALQNDAWISNIAIMNGYLHVQTAAPWHIGMPGVTLTCPSGEWVMPTSHTLLQVDENLQILDRESFMDMCPYEVRALFESSYGLIEVVFPIDIAALDFYSLTLLGHFESNIQGDWSMTINIDASDSQVRSLVEEVAVRYAIVESVMVSPLGVGFNGRVDGDINAGVRSLRGAVSIETPAGNIVIHEFPMISFSQMYEDNAVFSGFARADLPLDAGEVTAVIIGGVRIPVE